MEISRHLRNIDVKNEDQVNGFIDRLGTLIFRHRNTNNDILVSVESEDGDSIILEELSVHKRYVRDALHHCLYVSPPPFKITCRIRVVKNEKLAD